MKNIFCDLTDLQNESSVETFFVNRLLQYLNYPDSRIRAKETIEKLPVPKGHSVEHYAPDYVLLDSRNNPVIVIDAKHPNENLDKWIYQPIGYAATLNRRFPSGENPVQYAILANGHIFTVFPWDSEVPIFHLRFEDFVDGNEKLGVLRANLSYGIFNRIPVIGNTFDFSRPELNVLTKTFNKCHNLIWKKEKQGPTWAFYEFVKIIFIKMREDRKIHQKRNAGHSITKDDFIFSVHWIEELETATPNPVDTVLFKEVREEIEEQIRQSLKKRIFAAGENLRLSPSTTKAVVRLLQHYDLHGIDEDLNGRMFETFLSATIRGKELGQFFTPRPVVRYMTQTANLQIVNKKAPYILDGCCGTGGFLIEAMAHLMHKLSSLTNMTSTEREELEAQIKDNHLFGIEANEDLSRVARLNMYLHGDGGSKIFHADALDKNLYIEEGIPVETEEGRKELRNYLVKKNLKFDYVLTNPPFSMPYSTTDEHEKRILNEYHVALSSTGKPASSVKTNVLFIERYYDLLHPGGELLTIIDDTLLNGESEKEHRAFLRDKFIIRQVISLPFNAFFKADANIKTSILHLRKKCDGEKQGHVFMAISNNIGHNDHKLDTPNRDNLDLIASFYNEWIATGHFETTIIHNEDKNEPLGCTMQAFIVAPEDLNYDRLDAFYYAPELQQLRKAMKEAEKKGYTDIKIGKDLTFIDVLSSSDVKAMSGKALKYFEINDVTRDGYIVNWREDTIENLPTRGRILVKTNDVVFAKNNSSRGTTVIIPEYFDGALITTGFLGVQPVDVDDAMLIWSVLSSEAVRKQIYYLAVTASQPEIRQTIFEEEFLLPFPREPYRSKLITKTKQIWEARNEISSRMNEIVALQGELLTYTE